MEDLAASFQVAAEDLGVVPLVTTHVLGAGVDLRPDGLVSSGEGVGEREGSSPCHIGHRHGRPDP